MNDILLRVDHVKKYYTRPEAFSRKYVKAVDDVSLEIFRGETLGLVGESGCGKSTLGRVILRLQEKTEGNIHFECKDIYALSQQEMLHLRRNMQIIFQDPHACLNPRLTVENIIAEPLKIHKVRSKAERISRVKEVMVSVGLPEDMLKRYPHELSGGQQQRVGIARALVLKPQFIVCDEAVSALDVSVQAQILNLMSSLKEEYNLTYLFISHNLAVIRHVCDRIAVMYLGKIVEQSDRDELFDNPMHPYTKSLLSAVLDINDTACLDDFTLDGDIPNPVDPPSGCRFHPRCSVSTEKCRICEPELRDMGNGHIVACHNI